MATTQRPRSMLSLLRTRKRRARRLGRRFPTVDHLRKALAAALLVVAGLLATQPGDAAGEPTEPVLVAARDLPSGRALAPGDLRRVNFPVSLAPEGAQTDLSRLSGRVLAGATREGEPITDARVVSRAGGRVSAGRGASAVPVRLADPAVATLLEPGAKVDVVTVGEQEEDGRVLATDATVVTVSTPSGDSAADRTKGRLVLIALPRESATRVASVSLTMPVTVTLR